MKVVEFSHKLLIICFVLLGAFGQSSFAQSEKNALFENLNETVFNFHEVTPNLYRSGLVTKESVPYLKELGIKTVITFDNDPERVRREEAFLQGSGIQLKSIPWSAWDSPEDETIRNIHAIINDPAMQPVLVHCKHGQERTGVTVATWRIDQEHWDFDQAYGEMKVCGFRPVRFGHLKNYVYDFAQKHGHEEAKISRFERAKTNIFSFFYKFRKLSLFPK